MNYNNYECKLTNREKRLNARGQKTAICEMCEAWGTRAGEKCKVCGKQLLPKRFKKPIPTE